MFAIIGILMVLGAVAAGYAMEHGNFAVLFQPAELVIIFGASLGSMTLACPKDVLIGTFKSVTKILGGTLSSKAFYTDMLMMLSMLFMKIRREGLVTIEKDIEQPDQSNIFSGFLSKKAHHYLVVFICDTMRIFSTINIEAHEFENIMDADIEVFATEKSHAYHQITRQSDAMPGLGIVAAVLGVVLTMGKISEPPEVLGHSIGSALVGTFLGILMAYGIVGPIAQNLEYRAKEAEEALFVIKTALLAFVGGNPPQVALEAGRRAIPNHYRPTFQELEEAIKASKAKGG